MCPRGSDLPLINDESWSVRYRTINCVLTDVMRIVIALINVVTLRGHEIVMSRVFRWIKEVYDRKVYELIYQVETDKCRTTYSSFR